MAYVLSLKKRHSMKLGRMWYIVESGLSYAAVALIGLELGALGSSLPPELVRSALVLVVVVAASSIVANLQSKCWAGTSCARILSRGFPEYHPSLSFDERILEGRVIVRRGVFRFCMLLRVLAFILEWVFVVPFVNAKKGLFAVEVKETEWKDTNVKACHSMVVGVVTLHISMLVVDVAGPYYRILCPGKLQNVWKIDYSSPGHPQVLEVQRREGPFWERLWRNQRKMELEFIYQRHLTDHGYFTAEDAKHNPDRCGLPAYWFQDLQKLEHIVLLNLPSLAVDSLESSSANPGRGNRGKLTMALEALSELSGLKNTDVGDEMAAVVQDIPQASRFSVHVDVGRDFGNMGYSLVLKVLRSTTSSVGVEEARLAASIPARLALGLAVIPWQPWRNDRDGDYTWGFLPDRLNHLGELVEELVRIVDQCARKRRTSRNTEAVEDERELEELSAEEEDEDDEGKGKLRLQESALSAVCSLAHAASELHAHRGWLAMEPDVPSSRFCNAFSTLGPGDWPLETPIPKFGGRTYEAIIGWILAELMCPKTERVLLDFLRVGKRKSPSPNLVADSIRIFAYLLCPRMVYWHRFDKRLMDFPDPLCSIESLPHPSKVEAAVKGLIRRCCGKKAKADLSAFSKLHLAKILICQNIRDMDNKVAKLLLQCLAYCSKVRGKREINWFTREVLDTLRDLIATSSPSPRRAICKAIAKPCADGDWQFIQDIQGCKFANHRSSSGVSNCGQVPADLPARIPQDGDRRSSTKAGTWFAFEHCDPSAAGLAADALAGFCDSGCNTPLPDHALEFFSVLLRRFRVERVRSEDSQLKRYWVIFFLRIIDPICNPAWRPACTLKESLYDHSCAVNTDGLEALEDTVNTLLALRNVTRLLQVSVCDCYPAEKILSQESALLSILGRLLRILRYRPGIFKLPTQLRLDALSDQWVGDIRSNSAAVIEKLLRLIVPNHEARMRPFLQSYWARLREWKHKSEEDGGPGSTPAFEGLLEVIDDYSALLHSPAQEDLADARDRSDEFDVSPDQANSEAAPKIVRLTMRQPNQSRTVYCERRFG
ncbi:hypothetical protein CBR_g73493 [Chara braunii]|uniref:Uncharacterized protein n=1 Tax=Chara braunii TaxID=69332 RepID=A0A388MGC3_CHABU|nr:hypothetical protein CBR_g73493 [Chara braunii]|eukprot:GBG93535.1 hypothetical protein CBR_g73493 [Chara braunii]